MDLEKGKQEALHAWSAYHKERDRIINGATPPAPEMKSIIDPAYNATPGVPASGKPTPTAPPATPPVQATPVPIQPTAPVATPQPAPSQNAWEQVAVPPSQATQQVPTPAQTNATQGNVGDASKYPWLRPPGQLMKGEKPQDANAPDFGSLTVNAADEADRQTIGKLQGAYEQAKTPEVKNAISILVNPKSLREDKMKAVRDLKKAGVDINQLTVPVEQGPGFFGSIPTGLGF
jgi:hypothetical protein